MPTVLSPNKGYSLQQTGENAGTWGVVLDQTLSIIDLNMGGVLSLSVAGSTDVTLTSTQAENAIYNFTGALTGNISVKFPAVGSFYIIKNSTTGAHTLTVKTSAGGSTGPVVPQGAVMMVYTDGTNATPDRNGVSLGGVDSGTGSAYVVTTPTANTALYQGYMLNWVAGNDSAAAATLAPDSLTAKVIYQPGSNGPVQVTSGYIQSGDTLLSIYDTALNSGAGGWYTIGGSAVLDSLTLISTDSGASAGPTLDLYRDSASPAANDIIGNITYTGQNTTPAKATYVQTEARIDDATAATEDASYIINVASAGSLVPILMNAFGISVNGVTAGRTVQARLTLTTGVPVTTSDVTAATTVYLTSYKGNLYSIYNGSRWEIRALSSDLSVSVPSTTNTPFDIFLDYNSGTPQLVTTNWTNATTRATAIALQNGALVKSGTATQLYLGTGCTTGVSGQTEDSASSRFLWNYYNRVVRPVFVRDATASWNYSTAAWRQANASTSNQVNFVRGVDEDNVNLSVTSVYTTNNTTSVICFTSIGLDSTTAPASTSTVLPISNYGASNATAGNAGVASYGGLPGIGKHYLSWLEYGNTANVQSWQGTGAIARAGLVGSLLA